MKIQRVFMQYFAFAKLWHIRSGWEFNSLEL